MIELSRTIRFCLNGPEPALGDRPERSGQPNAQSHTTPRGANRVNAHSARPAMRGLGRFYQLHVRCGGQIHPATGYFINIKQIDQAVAATVLPFLQQLVGTTQATAAVPMGQTMQSMIRLLQEPLDHTVNRLRLDLTPHHALSIESHRMNSVIICQQYEFAAAHRLHTPQLSDQENRDLFGKCNNPSGHGHNYRLSVAVRAPISPDGHVTAVEELDALVNEAVIEPFDHQHLNMDVPQFAHLNPTVENITVTIYGMINDRIDRLGMTLDEVSVWETDRTVCTYRGPSA